MQPIQLLIYLNITSNISREPNFSYLYARLVTARFRSHNANNSRKIIDDTVKIYNVYIMFLELATLPL